MFVIRQIFVCVIFLFGALCFCHDQPKKPSPEHTFPQVLLLELHDWNDGKSDWVEVRYLGRPGGSAIWSEPGERVWRIQDRNFVLLGASGMPLPSEISGRTTVFIEIESLGDTLGPLEIHPRQKSIAIQANTQEMVQKLLAGLPGVDPTYLSQVANFLAGNLADLEVQGTSYTVSGYGPVIDSSGAWVGGRLDTVSPGGSIFVGQGAGANDNGIINPPNRGIAIGFNALNQNIDGLYNCAIGFQALANHTTGNNNIAIGYLALADDEDGDYNTALGTFSMRENTNGDYNTAVGTYSLGSNTTGINNTALGYFTLNGNTEGNHNTAVGRGALKLNTIGNRNTAIGYDSGPDSTDLINTTALGNITVTTASHQVRIGNSNVTSIGGQVGWSTLSDSRFKQDVKEDVPGLDFVLGLRPVTYKVNLKRLKQFMGVKATDDPAQSTVQSGFMAQEVDQLARKQGFRFSGIDAPPNESTPYALRYGQFVVPLVQAIKEQQIMIENLKSELADLKSRLEDAP